MLTRVIDFLKTRGITALFTSLTSSEKGLEHTEAMISSLMDTWILVAFDTVERQRSRHLYILKSRGMPHSDEVRPFNITAQGFSIPPSTRKAKPAPRAAKRTTVRTARKPK
jgi:circadian clock protein KaiC